MAEEQTEKRRPGRPRKEDGTPQPHADNPFARTFERIEDQARFVQEEVDNRHVERRPGTTAQLEPPEAAPDLRQPAPDLGKAANQMIDRVYVNTGHDQFAQPLPVFNPLMTGEAAQAAQSDGGMEVLLLRNYQPGDGEQPVGPKRLAGETISVKSKEGRRLVNLGIARFPDEDA